MTVEETLKRHNVLKIRFARDFNLSRPTFYEYMTKFDNNEKLPKEKYQIIFDSLFGKPLDHDSFMNRYNRYSNIYKRDVVMKLADLDPNSTDAITKIVSELKLSVDSDTGNSELIPFVKFLSLHYSDHKIVKGLLLYFNELNGYSNYAEELSNEEKWYLGNLYHLNKMYAKGIVTGESYYNEFNEKKNNLLIEKSSKKREIEKELHETLSPYITEVIKNSPDGTNNEEIIRMVIEKINAMNK